MKCAISARERRNTTQWNIMKHAVANSDSLHRNNFFLQNVSSDPPISGYRGFNYLQV